MIPSRFAPIAFAFILSCLMSAIIGAIATFRLIGPDDVFVTAWLGAWLTGWAVAFPVVTVVGPIARRLVAALTRSPEPTGQR